MTATKSNVVHPFRIADAETSIRHVFIHDLTLTALIGVHKHERKKPQRIRINLDLAVLEKVDLIGWQNRTELDPRVFVQNRIDCCGGSGELPVA